MCGGFAFLLVLSPSKVEMFGPIRKEKLDVLVKSLEKGSLVSEGLTRACKKTSKALDEVLETIITEHEETTNVDKTSHEDFVDTLVTFMHQNIDDGSEQNHNIDRSNMKAILLDMIVASIDTSAATIEWALSKLLRHPRVMKKLQDEIQNEVGNKRMVEEKDLKKLNYLDMVVDETLRLHPVSPLLLPRECRESITIDGYFIKEKTRVIVNALTIGHEEFESIPFGFGRRRCPGIQLGLRTVRFVLAQLVHCFNWKLPYNISPSNLNMDEKFGQSIHRAQHLHAIPIYRLEAHHKLE
ncbi:unnamed protein product [Trifolium pratense]|uniref:Uncharacterized protein n=1 Tax=Trifolium pratense TaxID=57577 RepID=A0ACB0JGL7_TRIPR|nr:unnamed protein product [Trifolium pratense]